MSQHDYSLADQAGAAFRADLNNVLDAIVTGNSGASAPATTFARMRWLDTTANVLKRRNAANSGWIIVETLDETFVLARSSNTILDESDIGKTIVATSTFTQTLTAAATLGDGWWVHYSNNGAGAITIDPNGAETIDGAATLVLPPGVSCTIVCNGTLFNTVSRQSAGIAQNSQSAAYTTVLADADKHILHPSADTTARIFTIDSNANVPYPIGTTISFINQNGAGVVTIAITSDTMRLAGPGTTGSRTLAANGVAAALKLTATEWIISGTGLT